MSTLILAIGLVLTIEGLVFALAPSYLEQMLEALKSIGPESRKYIGLGAVAIGVFLIWLARGMGV